MQHAINISTRGLGLTCPNPSVGCVIVKENLIIGKGVTGRGGRPHAESVALGMAGKKAKGSTVYVTLEPCAHYGLTPPCSDSLISAEVSRVVIATLDPDKRVSGKGIKKLQESGIEVVSGILEKEALEINEGYFKATMQKLPFVTLKLAVSTDSRSATKTGKSKWITSQGARDHSHMLRARNDAIVISSATVNEDNPSLTCRLPGMISYSPIRVLLDAFRKVPNDLEIFKNAIDIPLWIFTTVPSDEKINQESIKLGAKIIIVKKDKFSYGVNLKEVFKSLSDSGVTRVMVESGGKLASALLHEKLVDKIIIYRAPSLIGGDGLSSIDTINVENLSDSVKLELTKLEQFENNIIETYKVLK
ncbi:MAG: riboflavin biosynthesis protein RibD [Rhodospirillaceae bacterium]|nr:riboflavin biosynthesis protein RibD [Rhodospirillaceae bacterium]|tara:strand:+ start:638 stop:1720 length:1083 start_codon:yes stop_codon:yes gene_type:complete